MNELKSIVCRRCNELLGEIDLDGQYFRTSGVVLYHRTRLFCVRCDRLFNFIPTMLHEQGLTKKQLEVGKEICNGLTKINVGK